MLCIGSQAGRIREADDTKPPNPRTLRRRKKVVNEQSGDGKLSLKEPGSRTQEEAKCISHV